MKNWALVFVLTTTITALAGCSSAPAVEWKPDANAANSLSAGETSIEGYKVRPPSTFQVSPTDKLTQAQWLNGEPPVWYAQPGEEGKTILWEDGTQVRVIHGMAPASEGSTNMVTCETEVVPRQFRVTVRPTKFPANDANLDVLAQHDINIISQLADVKNFKSSPVEYGTISGIRFSKKTWSGDIPMSKKMPGVQKNEPTPAQGYCYAAMDKGKAIRIMGQAPKDDLYYNTIEQAALTITPEPAAPASN